jgi:hypothetical protein
VIVDDEAPSSRSSRSSLTREPAHNDRPAQEEELCCEALLREDPTLGRNTRVALDGPFSRHPTTMDFLFLNGHMDSGRYRAPVLDHFFKRGAKLRMSFRAAELFIDLMRSSLRRSRGCSLVLPGDRVSNRDG